MVALLVVLGVTLLGVGAFFLGRGSRPEEGAPRAVEGRLRGLPWGPFRPRGAKDGNGEPTRAPEVSAAVRTLLARGSEAALSALLAVPRAQYDASTWSDLSAIYIQRASDANRPAHLVDAIASADVALERQPTLVEARFNRALAVEHLGLRDQAATAWREYLLVDGSGPWAVEAGEHLRTVTAPFVAFKDEVVRSRAALARGDAATAVRVVGISPLEARLFTEMEALPKWAEMLEKDPAAAAEHFAVGRSLARVLRARGDGTMADAFDAIERASGTTRAALAGAHATLARTRVAMRTSPTDAEPTLRACAAQFASAGSPMNSLAALYAAIAAFEQGHRAVAAEALRDLLATVPEDHRSLRAMVLWQLALCDAAETNWGATIESLNESVTLFDRLGESMNAAFVRQILSEVYDAIGDYDKAWEYRAAVLPALGRTTTMRTETAISTIAYGAAQRGEWRVAISMLNLEIDVARTVRHAPQEVLAYVRRAVARSRSGDREGATRDLASARRVAAAMSDPALRGRAEADIAMVAWIDAANPQEAVAELTRSIEFHRQGGRDMYLPALHLERARAYRLLGNAAGVRMDLEAGIARLERDRKTLPDPLSRFGIFDTAGELFREAVVAALARNEEEVAFAYAERARARALLDVLGASGTPPTPTAIPHDTALVAFTSVDDRLIAFVVTDAGVRAIAGALPPEAVATGAVRLRDALAASDALAADRESRALYDALLAPLAEFVRGRTHLVMIPSPETAALPFGALRGPDGAYLIERHAISIAPSAASYAAMPQGRQPSVPEVLVVAASTGSNGREPLPSARREAFAVASQYRHVTTLVDEQATTRGILDRIASVDVIHFAGHGSSRNDAGLGATVLVTYDEKGEGTLTTRQIESLKLTRAPVVVLAACNTGRGEVRWSEGTLSVARAFLAAGAPAVVATLWQIDDEQSAKFFPRLHEYLARGLPVSEALRATQLDFIRGSGATPATWAAIEAIGR